MFDLYCTKYCQRKLTCLNDSDRLRFVDVISKLSSEPNPEGRKKLTNRMAYSYRDSDFQIIYEVDRELNRITVVNFLMTGDETQVEVFFHGEKLIAVNKYKRLGFRVEIILSEEVVSIPKYYDSLEEALEAAKYIAETL